jgi:hypothetical protein
MGEDGIEVIEGIIVGCRINMVSFVLHFRFEKVGIWGYCTSIQGCGRSCAIHSGIFSGLGANTANIL